MTQHTITRPSTFFERIRKVFSIQRQYWTLWLASRLRRSQKPQALRVLAGMLLRVVILCSVMVTIIIFDVMVLLVSVFQKTFQRKRHSYCPTLRANV